MRIARQQNRRMCNATMLWQTHLFLGRHLMSSSSFETAIWQKEKRLKEESQLNRGQPMTKCKIPFKANHRLKFTAYPIVNYKRSKGQTFLTHVLFLFLQQKMETEAKDFIFHFNKNSRNIFLCQTVYNSTFIMQ